MKRVVVFVLIASILGGCATFFRGDKQTLQVVTNPVGAVVSVDGTTTVTPAKITLKRNKVHEVTLTKPGYQGLTFKLKANWDAGGAGAVIADIVIPGGSIMFAIDTLVGADRKFNDVAPIHLSPATQPSPQLVQVFEHKGKLLIKADYDRAVAADKTASKNAADKKTVAASTPTPTPVNGLTQTDAR
jgi:hypothetical protein